MEEKLILAVCGHPVLYDPAAVFYRDKRKKVEAWVKVSEAVGLPVELCRKKWKGLRDTYLKKRKEEEKWTGSAGGVLKKWRFSAVLTFLDPFTTPREGTSGIGMAPLDHSSSDSEGTAPPLPPAPPAPPAPAAPAPAAATPAAASTSGAVKRRNCGARTAKRKRASGFDVTMDEREQILEELIQSLQRTPVPLLPPPPPPISPPPAWIEEERFLSSLAPSLHRLPPQQREFTKFQIHKLIYENMWEQ